MFGELCPANSYHMKTFYQEKIDMSQGAILTDLKECKGAGLNLYIDSCNSWNFWQPVPGNQVAASYSRNQFQTGEWMFYSCSAVVWGRCGSSHQKWPLSIACGLQWQRSLASWGRIYCLLNDLNSYSANPCPTFKLHSIFLHKHRVLCGTLVHCWSIVTAVFFPPTTWVSPLGPTLLQYSGSQPCSWSPH